jgi:hypothetical protein
MKKIFLLSVISITSYCAFGQYATSWPTTVPNTTDVGFVGLGVKPLPSSTDEASYNLQVHGSEDYIVSLPASSSIGQWAPNQYIENTNTSNMATTTINYGMTSRIGITNATTGLTQFDGAALLMTDKDFTLRNNESNSYLTLETGPVKFRLDGLNNRIWMGSLPTSGAAISSFGRVNVLAHQDNGLVVQMQTSSKTGLIVRHTSDEGAAIEVFNSPVSTAQPNFKVFGSGQVYARRYVTTLSNFPDYVFTPDYSLMEIKDLKTYIDKNNHLPNFPSAKNVEENGADLGELNRLLVEKVEELTLYIIQLEERIGNLKD